MTAPRHISEILAEWIAADPHHAARKLASPTIGAWQRAREFMRQQQGET